MVKKSIFSNPLVIDGSMSTSLERLGCDTDNGLWTAAALLNQPELVYQVHKEYFEAGARLAITDTYQANLPALKKAGLTEKQARQVIEKAVDYIRHADVLIIAGTSLTVYPAAGLIDYYRGDKLVLINKSVTPKDNIADLVIHEPVGETLGGIVLNS